ncbi:GPI-anchor transamidase subunit 8 (GPI8), putative [Leishmania panamensis]|uniref:GPI-anchor transamidase subunit 8 (GPI8), putative n=1 Tax=Leishmania panamensis TaxID=5679 RepID=A0A088S6R2_LEIPA|nr:GPI-anchor transamidase subunit 8 (GPI8), putative [Leishmania panamensis]AIN97216.1 GPI-anchor transamidase subunit 8 (GPI8), putative [Leishmania panamensis]
MASTPRYNVTRLLAFVLLVLAASSCVSDKYAAALTAAAATASVPLNATSKSRGNNWAVILSSSRYLFNYRHTANALSMYHLLRQRGIDDDHILLFLSDSFACDPRNAYPAEVFLQSPEDWGEEERARMNLYGCSAQVDYAGSDVDVRRFLSVLQGRYDENTPPTRRLLSDDQSNIIIYIAGHGAKSYFKFQDSEFLSSSDISETLMMMYQQRRYGRIVFLADTCHAIALCESVEAPNVVCLAASDAESESYSYKYDRKLGLPMTSYWMYDMHWLLKGTSCSNPHTRRIGNDAVSVLHQSWYNLNYHPYRVEVSGDNSKPVHRDAVNDPAALREWIVADFMCGNVPAAVPVDVRYDLE